MEKATRQDTKDHNLRLVFRTIYNEEAISRANIARATLLTRTTVSSLVAELMEDGLVEEIGFGSSQGGKPPILLSINPTSHLLIGLDLGNSEFRGGLFDLRGNLIFCHSLPVQKRRGLDAVNLIYALVEALRSECSGSLIGIGIGTPGITDSEAGVILEAVNLGWYDLPLQDLLADRFALPAYIANDSLIAAFGEYTFANPRESSNLVVVKVGQGISAGIILNGHPYTGDHFGAGEIGHVMVVDGGEQCTCGHFGCLETVASSRAIVKQAQEIMRRHPDSNLRRLAAAPEDITTDIVVQALNEGDSHLRLAVEEMGCYLGIAISYAVSALNVQTIVISGRMERLGEPLLDAISREVDRRVLQRIADETEIRFSELGPDIVLKGAAALVLSKELGVV